MTEVEFIYEGKKSVIQCNLKDKMKDICNKYISKMRINVNNIYFLYGGKIIEEELRLEEVLNNDDKERNKMSIIVNINKRNVINKIKKSKEIICPECGECIKIKIEDYRIILYECKNNHRIEDILLEQFEKMQEIDESKIKCNNCKERNKSNTYNNEFY